MLQVTGLATFGLCLAALTWESLHGKQLLTGWTFLLNDSEANGPGARAGSATWIDQRDRAWIFGGRGPHLSDPNTTQMWSDLWTLDVTSGEWQRLVAPSSAACGSQIRCTPAGRELASMCGSSDLGTVVVFGGRVEDGTTVDDMLILRCNDRPQQWQLWKGAPLPAPRYDALSWCDEEAAEMWLIGGYGTNGYLLHDSWRLTLGNLSWSRAALPKTECTWTTGSDHSDDSSTALNTSVIHASQPLALLWRSGNGSLHLMCDRWMSGNNSANNDDPNIQLWKHQSLAEWHLVAESRYGAMTWPGSHRHGGTCSDSCGNLWLFGGQSEIGGHRYLNNDVWSYDVSMGSWSKAELPSNGIAQEPEQRHLVASWCGRDAMFVFGGSVCGDGDVTSNCIRGDLWMLNMSMAPCTSPVSTSGPPPGGIRQNRISIKKPHGMRLLQTTLNNTTTASKMASDPSISNLHPPPRIFLNTIPKEAPATSAIPPTVPVLSENPTGVSSAPALNNAFDQPTRHEVQEKPDLHGAYGSIIFFGISLSMFALSGVVIFFRRCVSCPPRENILLKEPPPVRYTVIPNESYTI